ncbi:DUF4148 domain-containing protein [Halopseudomonas pachastrellae]|nr:DUF4148 domain-containing protein [Halopseudomonas pachastrellae]
MSKKIRFAVLLSALFAAGVNAQPFAADMTRQQVQEDLAAWRQSGLEALSRGESGRIRSALNTRLPFSATCN